MKVFGTATAAKEGGQTAIRDETVSTFFVCRPGTYSSTKSSVRMLVTAELDN